MPQQTTVGVVLFLSGRGAGGISGGPVKKIYGFNGGVKRKNIGFKGEATQKIPSNFVVMAFLIMQTANQNAKNQHF